MNCYSVDSWQFQSDSSSTGTEELESEKSYKVTLFNTSYGFYKVLLKSIGTLITELPNASLRVQN